VGTLRRAGCGLASGPRIVARSGNGFSVSRLSVALAALIAVIGANLASAQVARGPIGGPRATGPSSSPPSEARERSRASATVALMKAARGR
jgi:hypothetical protein